MYTKREMCDSAIFKLLALRFVQQLWGNNSIPSTE